jgi:hypothetical protein
MIVLAQRVGGSGHAGKNLEDHFKAGHIPRTWEDAPLVTASLNFVLEVGKLFRTPSDGLATSQYVTKDETYYLQAIRLRRLDPRTRESKSDWLHGLIHRNRPHPKEFDNVIEVIAPDVSSYLHEGKKEWFQLDGPFEAI